MDEGVGAEIVLFRQLLPKPLEVEAVYIQVVDQAVGEGWDTQVEQRVGTHR